MGKKNKIILSIVLIIVILVAIYMIVFSGKNKEDYITSDVKRGNLEETVVANGSVHARDVVEVGAQVSGQIKKLYVKLGDFVKKGDLIAQIDSVKQENELNKQKAQLKILKANLNYAKIDEKNSLIQYERELELFKHNASSKENVENKKTQLSLKQAALNQIQVEIEQNLIELNSAKTDLEYTKIIAPIDGTIISIPVQEGKTVNAFQSAPTIAKIADLSRMEIRIEIPEGDLPKIKKGMKVYYSIFSNTDDKKEAIISSIDPANTKFSDESSGGDVFSSSSSSSSDAVYYYAKALVDNKDNFLKIGMTTENKIIITKVNNVLIIPISALNTDESGYYVNILKNKKNITKKHINVGIEDEINLEVKSGISENEKVVISSLNKDVSAE